MSEHEARSAPDMAGLDPEELRALIEFRDDKSQAGAWKRFGEITRRLELELTRETTPEERLLSIGWLAEAESPPRAEK